MKTARARRMSRTRLKPTTARPKAQSNSLVVPRKPRSAFAGGDPFNTEFAGNFASRGSADADWLQARLQAVSRVRDVINNEPLAASTEEQKLSLLVGEGWLFRSTPDAAAFGLDPISDEYNDLARSIDRALRRRLNDPLFRSDWEESLPWDLQLDLMARNYIGAEGEALALVLFDEDSVDWGTRLQVLDPDRLAQPAGLPDGSASEILIEGQGADYTLNATDIRAGVARDGRNRPIAYHILEGHPHDLGVNGALNRFMGKWYPTRTPGFPTDTRPCVLHVFKPRRAGQTRGLSDFVSALGAFQAFRDMGEAERRARIINSLIVAQYTSAIGDPEALAEILGAKNADGLLNSRTAFYEEHGVNTIAGSRVIQPFPGDKLEWNSEMRSANEWVDAMSFLALQAGAPVGLGYSMSTRDYSRTTYTSGRMENNDAFRGIKRDRSVLRHKAVRPLRLAHLQEAYELGELAIPRGAPSIWDAPDAYIGGKDVGPAQQYVDPAKDGGGDRMEVENLSESPSGVAARRGKVFEEVVAEAARDKRILEQAGLKMGDISALAASVSGSDDDASPAPRN